MFKNMTLKTKLLVWPICLALLLSIIASVAIYSYARSILVHHELDSLKALTEEKSLHVEQVFNNSKDLSAYVSGRTHIKNYLQEENPEPQNESILAILEGYNIANAYSAIYIMDPEGGTLVSTDESFIGKNYSFREYFQDAIDGLDSIHVARGITSGELGYYFASRIMSDSDELLGVVVLKLKPQYVESTVGFTGESVISKIILTDEFGVVISASDESLIYHSIGSLSEEALVDIENSRRYEGVGIDSLGYEDVESALRSSSTVEVFQSYNKYEGKEQIISTSSINGFPFYILVEQDPDYVTDPINRIALIIASTLMITALIITLAVLLLSAKLISPLNELTNITNMISKGDWSKRFDVKSNDEVGQLGTSFNVMADKLQNSLETVESQVKERTEKIQELNKAMTGREIKMLELKDEIKKLKGEEESETE